MVKYKLIKEYPGSPKLGTIEEVEHCFKNLTMGSNGKYLYNISESPEFWELVVEKDYEILSLIEGKFIYPCDKYGEDFINQLFNTLGVSIHSVKRLSDGEIFTIGDKVFSEYVNYTINKIGIVNDKCMVSALYDTNNPNGSRLHYNLNNIKKAKQPLFTTEDGVDIFEGNEYYYINSNFSDPWGIGYTRADCPSIIDKNNLNYKRFSTKEKAEEFILMNKPLLSLSDVWDNLKVKDQKEVLKFVKSKLNK